ncbi:MAG: winged helix-turn-helix domain-containing protein [Candidatus Bathyarchaeia archaeon]
MIDFERTKKLLKPLTYDSRLRILNWINSEISNPAEIAKKLGRHRSTIEHHLRVLFEANIVEKLPSLTRSGQLSNC